MISSSSASSSAASTDFSYSLSLSIRFYLPSLPTGSLICILCLCRAVLGMLLLVKQHCHIHEKEFIGECHLWVRLGIEKCAIPIMKSGKRYITKGIELQSQERIRKGKIQVFRIIWSGHYQTGRDERKNKNRVLQTNENAFWNQTL